MQCKGVRRITSTRTEYGVDICSTPYVALTLQDSTVQYRTVALRIHYGGSILAFFSIALATLPSHIHPTAMHTLKPVASSTLSLPTDNYIYKLTPAAPGTFAAISSDDSLRVFDANLNASVLSPAAHAGVTSLSRFGDSLLATGGRDGKVKVWDARAGKSVVEMQTGEFIVAKLSKSIPSWDAQIGYMHGSSAGESAGEKLKCDFGLIPSSETGPGSLGGVLPRDEYRRGGHGAGLIPGRCSLLVRHMLPTGIGMQQLSTRT